MYHCKVESINSDEPIYQKLQGGKDHFFFAEARVARDYVRTGLYERSIINWSIDNFSSQDKAFIDIGAHMGHYTCNWAWKSKHVYSFECSPKSFNYLCANIALQEQNYNVTKYNVALSNKEGIMKYYIRDPKDGGGNGICKLDHDDTKNTPYIEVPTKTLDSFKLRNIGFIKIDVEGHEKEVLEGAIETLKENNYPKFMFESWSPGKENDGIPSTRLRSELFSFIESLGYKIIPVSGWPEEFLAVHPLNP
jgi:FkbM family methyltransferase